MTVHVGTGPHSSYGTGTVENVEALDLLSSLRPNATGAVVTDPPFFVGFGRNSGPDGGFGVDPWADESTMEQVVRWSDPVAREVSRALRPGGAFVVMGGSQSLAGWEVVAERNNLRWMAELTVLWNSGKPRMRSFGSLVTNVRWYSKLGGRHTFNSGTQRSIYSNVIVCSKVPLADREHPSQKPVELTNFLISLLTNEGDTVVDPFCGSGSTLVSAAMCGRPFIGGDNDYESCQLALRRVNRVELEESELRPLYLWNNGKTQEVEG